MHVNGLQRLKSLFSLPQFNMSCSLKNRLVLHLLTLSENIMEYFLNSQRKALLLPFNTRGKNTLEQYLQNHLFDLGFLNKFNIFQQICELKEVLQIVFSSMSVCVVLCQHQIYNPAQIQSKYFTALYCSANQEFNKYP